MIIDKFNPQLSAQLVLPLAYWQKMDSKRQAMMKECLREILASTKLSKNLHEVVLKSLG